MYRPRCVVAAFLLLLLRLPANAQEAGRIRDLTASIAEGADRETRRSAITKLLTASGIGFELQEAGEPGRSLTNIVATVRGETSKTILLGAHYDRVAQGNGVLDNGASCAVLLNLLESLKARPAALTVRVVFFDLEESGLIGSRAYFARVGNEPKPAYAVNLDIFGYGDSFFVASPNPGGTLTTKFQQAAGETNLAVRVSQPAQYPSSDHISMIQAGIETLGVALIDGAEVDSVLGMSRGGQTPGAPPRVLTIIHTARDTMEILRPADVAKGAAALDRVVRTLN